jgi:hypothetical protein
MAGTPKVQIGLENFSSPAAAVGTAKLVLPEQLPAETAERLARALGQAVARCWSVLPQEAQRDLFEAAVAAEGEPIRQQLAVFLHEKHTRTIDSLHARATPEPDSLGG